MKRNLSVLACALLPFFHGNALASSNDLETIEVTGDFKKESLITLSASASVFTDSEMQDRGATHLENVLNQAANINFTAGASRGKFIQMRGIGLRSQFVDPINPSIALLIDGINYSGLGGAGVLFDTEQLEIYRGPQGTRFGADALAGVVQISGVRPSDNAVKLQVGAGNYNAWQAGIAAGVALSDSSAVRASFYQNTSDGYVDNVYLDKPTQDLDEASARVAFSTQLTDALSSTLVLHYIDIDNGYDGFTLDNSRTSVADEPGQDTQESKAAAWTVNYTGFDAFNLQSKVTGLDADLVYSYDEDWVCKDATKPTLCVAGLHADGYSSTDRYLRDRQDASVDVFLSGKQNEWVLGAIVQRRDVDLVRQYTWFTTDFNSRYEVNNQAIYGQKETLLDEQTRLIAGLRVERYEGDYSDSYQLTATTDDTMVGGKIALEYQVLPKTMIYTSLTRGFKAGGINSEALAKAQDDGLALPVENQSFAPEYLWNAEFGVRGVSLDNKHTLRLTAFYMHREDMQLKAWKVQDQRFAGYIANADGGKSYGLEIEGQYQFDAPFNLSYSLGYLDTEIDKFTTQSGVDQDGRDQAQAPKYQYAFTGRYDFADHWQVSLGVEGKDEYFFSDSHNAKAPNTNLVNAGLSYQRNAWRVNAYIRNALDKDVPVRGFEFGNNPLDGYTTHNYVQWGEPRVWGVTVTYSM
ncbi:TonB-dependent receptor [Pseudoalteromonas xiamenensis]|uniref:TonB-dependent receptor n=1 Tax=Pseudoalteromonas xiamenensis TaxID=882626 RepID=A0A975DEZ8_9GAMM|nr:TonB-dependent receptor [Pseudoalteromonas xiamenensis]QTH70563.1 TonB-dependent receptor [Pseudoalteromonas xiamenensis]